MIRTPTPTMSRTPTPEHEAWLLANGMYLVDQEYGHWAETQTGRGDGGYRDLTHTAEGKWFAMLFAAHGTGAIWEGPEFGAPEVAWVHAELSNWGQP